MAPKTFTFLRREWGLREELDLLSHDTVTGGSHLHLVNESFLLRWQFIYSWQYPGMQFSFKPENAQFLSDLWIAPTARILSWETTLGSLPDTAVGLVALGWGWLAVRMQSPTPFIPQGRDPASVWLPLLGLWALEIGQDNLQSTGQVSVYILEYSAFIMLN